MRVLIDECAPRALKGFLSKHGHESLTVQEAGWSGKENGELLAVAEAEFNVLVTVDTNLRYQQNLAGHRIAIVILQSSSNRLEHLRQHFPALSLALEKINLVKSFTSSALTEPSDSHQDSQDAPRPLASPLPVGKAFQQTGTGIFWPEGFGT
jgi:predicted nuclease of predicted toxin-antitoxin system